MGQMILLIGLLLLSLVSVVGSVAQAQVCGDPERSYLNHQRALYQRNFPASEIIKDQIVGHEFVGTRVELNALKQMISNGYPSQALQSRSCASVLCFLAAAFGSEELALRALNFAVREGFVLGLMAPNTPIDMYASWTVPQVRLLDTYMQMIPHAVKAKLRESLSIFARAKKIKEDDAKDLIGTRAVAQSKTQTSPGQIIFYDSAFNEDHFPFSRTLFHELGHHFDFSFMDRGLFHQLSGFDQLTFWQEVGVQEIYYHGQNFTTKLYSLSPNEKFVSAIAKKNPYEDFAETFSMYIDSPWRAKAEAPQKYDFIRNKVFSGIEFLNPRLESLRMLPLSGLLKACLQDVSQISFVVPGQYVLYSVNRGDYLPQITSRCLDRAISQLMAQNPHLCGFEEKIVREEIFRSIAPAVERIERSLTQAVKGDLQKRHYVCSAKKDVSYQCRQASFHFPQLFDMSLNPQELSQLLGHKMKF